jgi:hypothetical protein
MKRDNKPRASATQEHERVGKSLNDFELRINKMHEDFTKFRRGDLLRMPDWERLERDLILFSRGHFVELRIRTMLDSLLFKFQNRKKIWLKWVEEVHQMAGKEEKS